MEAILKKFSLLPADIPMILIGMVLFYLFCRIFGRKVIAPYIQLIETREAASEGALNEAAANRRSAEELRARFEARIAEARTAATLEKLKTLDAAKKDAARLLENAEAQARHVLDGERAALARAHQDVRRDVRGMEESLVNLLLGKLESQQGKEGRRND